MQDTATNPAVTKAAPRLVIAGVAGDCGKTLVSTSLLLAARKRGLRVSGFKKGPDYIDAAWLTWAAGRQARNLDSFLMGFDRAAHSFTGHAVAEGLNVVEGNRGLYDGLDARGTHSTAELAKALGAPVVLVVNVTKVTRSAAAWVLGCQKLDPEIAIAGVVLNQVASDRQEAILREAIESACGIPVLGAIPRLKGSNLLPWRHLGLVPPEEHEHKLELERGLLEATEGHLDFDALLACARGAAPLVRAPSFDTRAPDSAGLRIGYIRDSAFTFYYPENLEALEESGATLVPVSSLSGAVMPEDLHGLYIGGGFPETHAAVISRNTTFLGSLARAAAKGLPVYAECGGLMLLARAIRWKSDRQLMAGVLPIEVEVCEKPQGHGYAVLRVDEPNPFFAAGTELKGHEFHYSRIMPAETLPPTACCVERGAGCYSGRDGISLENVWASYTHLHALATPEWATGLLAAARRFAVGDEECKDCACSVALEC